MIDAHAAFARIVAQHQLGPRFAGSAGHARVQMLLASWLASADQYREHTFTAEFFGEPVTCRNLWGRFHGQRQGRLLLGTHYDTRPWADRDADERRRHDPVPGANDGGSGTAVLAELAGELARRRDRMTVDLVLFDAEDWHEIDGKEVSLGARRFVDDLGTDERPDRVVILDMIAGRDLALDVDVHCQTHDPSYGWTLEVFQLGHSLGLSCFALDKEQPYKWVVCDHSPFMEAGIPSALLIDLDYPPWHTVHDTPGACDVTSLQQIGMCLDALLFA
jgi:hypothetical protein